MTDRGQCQAKPAQGKRIGFVAPDHELLQNIENLVHDRDIKINHKTVRIRLDRSGPLFSSQIHRNPMRRYGHH
jgi:hypothetical protein